MFDSSRIMSGSRGVSSSRSYEPAPQPSWREAARNADREPGRPAVSPAEIANVFVQLRHYLQISLHQAAALLNTDADIIAALESGAVRDLPAWPETTRIVRAYAGLANIDPGPVLRGLEALVRSSSRNPAARIPARQTLAPAPYAAGADHEHDGLDDVADDAAGPARPWSSRLPSRSMVWRMCSVAAFLAVLGVGSQQGVLQAAVGKLPAPVAQLARDTSDMLLVRVSSRFEGLPWIDVADPRSRRGDKLRSKPR
jgi:hypothetical protein